MRLLLPVHHFPPRYTAGAEQYVLRIAHAMQARGHEVQVVTIEEIDAGPVGQLSSTLECYQNVPVWRLSFNLIDAPERTQWNYDNPLLESWFAQTIVHWQPDLIHFHAGYLMGVGPMRAARSANVPMVLSLHDYWFLCPRHTLLRSDGTLCAEIPADPTVCARCVSRGDAAQGINGRLATVGARLGSDGLLRLLEWAGRGSGAGEQEARREVMAEALSWLDAVHAPTKYIAARFANAVAHDRMHTFPMGIEPALVQQPVRVRAAGDPVRFGFTGQIAEHKGIFLLVQAMRSLTETSRPIELHIHGYGSPAAEEELRRQIAGDDRIFFHGRYNNGERWQLLAELDVAVVPSIWYENAGTVTVEALAAGVPVLVAKTGGVYESVLEGVQGLYLEPGSLNSLRTQMQRVADDFSLLERLQQGARSSPVRTVEQEMVEVDALYAHVLQAHQLRRQAA